MNITGSNISYILPLDSIDINYVSDAKYKEDSSVLLWNANNFGRKKHYEFQILASKKNEDAEIDKDVYYNTYRCKVCDIDVPKIFTKQHSSSPKHKLCLKIIEKALERTKDSMLQNYDNNDIPKCPQHLYFCEPCAVVVKVQNRKEHEESKTHFKSVIHDKFLRDLLMIYIDRNYIDEVQLDYMNNDINNDDDNSDYTVDIFSDTDESDTEHNVTVESMTSTSKLTLIDYISMLNEKSDGANHLSVDGNEIKVVTKDKSVVKISEQHFHGFYDMNGYTICGTCQYVVKDMDGDIDNHKMCSDHIEKISEPFEDMHCIRSGSIFKHCVLCNTIVSVTMEAHKQTKLHIDLFKRARVVTNALTSENKQTLPIQKDGNKLCLSCNLDSDLNDNYHRMHFELFPKEMETTKIPNKETQKTETGRISNEPVSEIKTVTTRILNKPKTAIEKETERIVNKPVSAIKSVTTRILSKPKTAIEKETGRIVNKPVSAIKTVPTRILNEPKTAIETETGIIGNKPVSAIESVTTRILNEPKTAIETETERIVNKPVSLIKSVTTGKLNEPKTAIETETRIIVNESVSATKSATTEPKTTIEKETGRIVNEPISAIKTVPTRILNEPKTAIETETGIIVNKPVSAIELVTTSILNEPKTAIETETERIVNKPVSAIKSVTTGKLNEPKTAIETETAIIVNESVSATKSATTGILNEAKTAIETETGGIVNEPVSAMKSVTTGILYEPKTAIEAEIGRILNEPLSAFKTVTTRIPNEPKTRIETETGRTLNEPVSAIKTVTTRILNKPKTLIETETGRIHNEPLSTFKTVTTRIPNEPRTPIETETGRIVNEPVSAIKSVTSGILNEPKTTIETETGGMLNETVNAIKTVTTSILNEPKTAIETVTIKTVNESETADLSNCIPTKPATANESIDSKTTSDNESAKKIQATNNKATNVSFPEKTGNETDRIYCTICNVNMITNNLSVHLKSRDHNTNTNLIINETQNTPSTSSATKVSQSLLHLNTAKNTVEELDLHEHMKRTKHLSSLKCTVCNYIVPNSARIVSEHVSEATHMSNLKHLISATHHHLKLVDGRVKCSVCTVNIRMDVMKEHINSRIHYTNFQRVLNHNMIVNDKGKHYCFICSLRIDDFREMEHVNSKNHKKGLHKESPSFYYCPHCNIDVPCTEYYIASHNISRLHQGNRPTNDETLVQNILKSFIVDTPSSVLFCRVCEEYLPTDEFDLHIANPLHVVRCVIASN